MTEKNVTADRLDSEELRRLWHWTMDAIPGADTIPLRQLALALGEVVKTDRGPAGKPVLLKDSLPPAPVVLKLGALARRGAVVAFAQAATGASHPNLLAAPFGALEYMILPMAKKLGVLEDLERELKIR